MEKSLMNDTGKTVGAGFESAPTLIIGYGNPLRSDDGLGWRAAEKLARIFDKARVRVIRCHQLLPELAEDVSRADRVIFIDACLGEPPGQVICRDIDPDSLPEAVMFHHLTPPMLLACVKAIYRKCPEAIILSVTGKSFECGDQLSTEVRQTFPLLSEAVEMRV